MNPDELPDPMLLERLAEEAPPKVPLRDYRTAMQALREKRYSYQDIANWMSEHLNVEVSRSQVSYILNAPPDVLQQEEDEERMDEADEER
jgi:hypothetical protein